MNYFLYYKSVFTFTLLLLLLDYSDDRLSPESSSFSNDDSSETFSDVLLYTTFDDPDLKSDVLKLYYEREALSVNYL